MLANMFYTLCGLIVTLLAILFMGPASILASIGEKLFSLAQHIEMFANRRSR